MSTKPKKKTKSPFNHTPAFSDVITAAGLQARPAQRAYAGHVARALAAPTPGWVSLLQADTGTGKSLGYLVPAIQQLLAAPAPEEGGRAQLVVATNTVALMRQLIKKDLPAALTALGATHLTVGELLGVSNYVSKTRLQNALAELGELDSEDQELTQALTAWTDSIHAFGEHFGGLPAGLTAPEICCLPGSSDKDSRAERDAAAVADIVVTSHAMVGLDMLRFGRILAPGRRRYLVIDEADLFYSMLRSWESARLNLTRVRSTLADSLRAVGGARLVKKALSPLDTLMGEIGAMARGRRYVWSEQASAMVLRAHEILGNALGHLPEDVRGDLQQHLELEQRSRLLADGGVGVSLVREEPALVSMNPSLPYLFSHYAQAGYEAVILTSGTLSNDNFDPMRGMEWISRGLGLYKRGNLLLQQIVSPEHYGSLSFHLAGPDFPKVFVRAVADEYTETGVELNVQWLARAAGIISGLRKNKRRVLVLTGSHRETEELASMIANLGADKNLTWHTPGEKLSAAASRYLANQGCLITAGGGVGLDLRDEKGLAFDELIITRAVYAPPQEEKAQALVDYLAANGRRNTHGQRYTKEDAQRWAYFDSISGAIRRMRQSIGRGIRGPEDHMEVWILDPRFPLALDFAARHKELRHSVPQRFLGAYRKAHILGLNPPFPGPDTKATNAASRKAAATQPAEVIY